MNEEFCFAYHGVDVDIVEELEYLQVKEGARDQHNDQSLGAIGLIMVGIFQCDPGCLHDTGFDHMCSSVHHVPVSWQTRTENGRLIASVRCRQ